MVTYTTLWSPIGYIEVSINHDCRGTGGMEMCLLGFKEEHREAESILLGKDTSPCVGYRW